MTVTLPRVSLVVPSLNQAGYLAEALHSIADQNYPDLELIIMDGGSTDHSVEVIQDYSRIITDWTSAPDGGQADALRTGFERTSGEVLGWLNSDDLLLPGALHAVGQHFRDRPAEMWAYGDSHIIGSDGRTLWRRPMPNVRFAEMTQLSVHLPQESTFFRRQAYEAAGGIEPSLRYAMDYDLWLRLWKIAPPGRIDGFLGCFRMIDGQKSADGGAYEAEVNEVKGRLGLTRAPRWRSTLLSLRFSARAVGVRLRVGGWRAPVELATRQLRTRQR
jgi:glycosyltransferase involved in cell wall biosynthesis